MRNAVMWSVAVCVLWSADGFADERRKEAERFFRAGDRAFKAAQYENASAAFEAAYERLPLPAIAFSAAQAYRLQYARDEDPQKLRRAVELYRTYLKEKPSGKRAADASANLADLLPAYGRLGDAGAGQTVLRETKLMVSASVEGASGSIDGGPMQALPLVALVEPGTHVVRVEAKGYFGQDKKVPVVEGQFRAVEAELAPMPALVNLQARDGSRIAVDGRTVGEAPLAKPLALPAGPHFITVTRRGTTPFSTQVESVRGETVDVTAEQSMTTQRIVSWSVMGAGGLVLLGSGVSALMAHGSNSSASDLESLRQTSGLTPDQLAEFQGHVAERDQRLRNAGILLGVGLGIAAGGALLYFMDTPEAEERPGGGFAPRREAPSSPTGIQASPVIGADSAGVALSGRF